MNAWRSIAILSLSFVLLAACAKQRSAPLPISSIAPSSQDTFASREPEATLSSSKERIEPGEQARLTWTTLHADEAVLEPGAGPVPLNGTADVRPTADTTYTLWARGPGGETSVTARIMVEDSRPLDAGRGLGVTSEDLPPPDMFTGTFEQEIAKRLRDVHFDYDANEVTPDQMAILDENAEVIQALFRHFTTGRIIVQGHCDERGSNEYNLALGDRRARAAVDYLGQRGVPLGRLMLVSYGEEQPLCREATDACYAQNRRAHFAAAP